MKWTTDVSQFNFSWGKCYISPILDMHTNEMYYGHEKDFSSFEEFSVAIAEYIDYYNNKRIQAKTNWMPPVKYRETSIRSA